MEDQRFTVFIEYKDGCKKDITLGSKYDAIALIHAMDKYENVVTITLKTEYSERYK